MTIAAPPVPADSPPPPRRCPRCRRRAGRKPIPSRPVRIIVATAAGGTTDLVGPPDRAMADRQARPAVHGREPHRRQQQHRHRGRGALAAPDGYTLFMANSVNAINTSLYQEPQLQLLDRSRSGGDRDALAAGDAGASFGAGQDACRSSSPTPKPIPARSTWAPAARARPAPCAGELFQMMSRREIPARAVSRRVAGDDRPDRRPGADGVRDRRLVDPVHQGRARCGRWRSPPPTRTDALPDVPPIADFLPGYEATSWSGLMAPKGTPPEIVDKLNRESTRASPIPSIRARSSPSADRRSPPRLPSSDGSSRVDTAKWAKVIKVTGAKAE